MADLFGDRIHSYKLRHITLMEIADNPRFGGFGYRTVKKWPTKYEPIGFPAHVAVGKDGKTRLYDADQFELWFDKNQPLILRGKAPA